MTDDRPNDPDSQSQQQHDEQKRRLAQAGAAPLADRARQDLGVQGDEDREGLAGGVDAGDLRPSQPPGAR